MIPAATSVSNVLGRIALLAACLLSAGASIAQEDSEPAAFRISGFGTLSRSVDDHHGLALIRDISQQPQGRNYDVGANSRIDSRLGLQMAYRFSHTVEAVAQVVARYQTSSEFHHYVELGYLDWQAMPGIRLRAGRVGYDLFLMSDHRNLGYAYPWVRPPIEHYAWVPIFGLDGADITHEFRSGDALWRLRAQAGQSDFVVPMGASNFNFHANNLWSLTAQREQGPWRIKAGLSGFTSTKEVEALAGYRDGLAQIAAANVPGISSEAAYLLDQSRFKDVRLQYVTLGIAYDDGTWFGQAELGSLRTQTTFVPQTDMGYAVLGRRFGAWSPFVMLGMSRPDRKLARPIYDWGAIGQAALQNTAYGSVINATRFDQETLSLGTRWDFHSNAAVKLQYDHTRIHANGYAAWFRKASLVPRESSVNMLTLSLDFVF